MANFIPSSLLLTSSTTLAEIAEALGCNYDSDTSVFYMEQDKSFGFKINKTSNGFYFHIYLYTGDVANFNSRSTVAVKVLNNNNLYYHKTNDYIIFDSNVDLQYLTAFVKGKNGLTGETCWACLYTQLISQDGTSANKTIACYDGTLTDNSNRSIWFTLIGDSHITTSNLLEIIVAGPLVGKTGRFYCDTGKFNITIAVPDTLRMMSSSRIAIVELDSKEYLYRRSYSDNNDYADLLIDISN